MKALCTVLAAVLLTSAALAADDDPLVTANTNLTAAVDGKKPAAEIKRLAVVVLTEAKKQMGPAPADADKDTWEAHVKYAQQTAEYAEYALYSAATGAPSATAVDLISTLEAQAPKSKYLNQDAYLMVANAALTDKQADRASSFARKSLTATKGAKPEQAATTAHYIIGVVAASKNDFATADKELRAALPGVKGNASLEGPTLYFLGEAEYNVGRKNMDRVTADQGIKYILQAALIPGQYQSAASAEAKRMKTELGEK